MPYSKNTGLNAVLTLALKRRWLAITLQTTGITIACWLLFFYARRSQDERIQLKFETEASRVAERVTENLNVYQEVVRSIASFYAGSEVVSRDEFNAFVRRALTQHSGIHASPPLSAFDSNKALKGTGSRTSGLRG
jgi:CHASE1-domain containing sensor protein